MKWHEHVEHTTNVPNVNWRDEVKLSDGYAQYRLKFINMSSEFETM